MYLKSNIALFFSQGFWIAFHNETMVKQFCLKENEKIQNELLVNELCDIIPHLITL